MPKRLTLTVTIECLDSQTEYQGQNKLHSWIEHYGHTASSFGFEFLYVGVVPRTTWKKRVLAKDK